MSLKGIKATFKFWLETEDGYVFGEGPFELLLKIRELETLSAAAQALGMSYRHAWGIIKNVERRVGTPILKTRKGGTKGGGGAMLTSEGHSLVNEYHRLKEAYSHASRMLTTETTDQALGLEGHIRGRVLRVKEGRPSIVDVQIEGGGVVKFLFDEKKVREKGIAPGDRLRFKLRDASFQVEKE
jgi:molybdate transport repressor ModE-like protein